jgi:hypothetical protein
MVVLGKILSKTTSIIDSPIVIPYVIKMIIFSRDTLLYSLLLSMNSLYTLDSVGMQMLPLWSKLSKNQPDCGRVSVNFTV